jgi:transcriptional regulator with XRE-family HTH domain
MDITNTLTDERVLAELGERITEHRLNLQLTQAQLAEQAGVSKRTLERVEAGASAQLAGVIRILRVLKLLPGLELLVPPGRPRPTDLLKRKGRVRQRASTRNREDDKPWSWKDDS